MTEEKKDLDFDSIEKAWNWNKEEQAKPIDQIRKEARAKMGNMNDGVTDASPEANREFIRRCLERYAIKKPDDKFTHTLLTAIAIHGLPYEAIATYLRHSGHPFITPEEVQFKEKIAMSRVMEALV